MNEQTCPVCNKTFVPDNINDFIDHVKNCGKEEKVQLNKKESKSKYGNVRAEYKDMRFDSQLEADYCKYLDNQNDDKLLYYLRQVPFHLPGGVIYRVDFMEVWNIAEDVLIKYTDTKGYMTAQSKMKIKMTESLYPVNINIVKKGDF